MRLPSTSRAWSPLRYFNDGNYVELYKHTPNGQFQQVARTGNVYRSFQSFSFLGDDGTVVFAANRYPVSPTRYGLYTGKGDGMTTAVAENLGEFAASVISLPGESQRMEEESEPLGSDGSLDSGRPAELDEPLPRTALP